MAAVEGGGKELPETLTIDAKPFGFQVPASRVALLLIDLQRDFILPGGFGDIQAGTNLTAVKACVDPCVQLLRCFRELSLPVIHTREGHLPDLSDCPSSKLCRQASAPLGKDGRKQHNKVIGDKGEMGRLLVRGEYGHDLLDEVQPKLDELVIDKPGKGAFWNTGLMEELMGMGITHLVIGGVTTECCVTTTAREANDRGFESCIISECTAGYNGSFKGPSLDMIHWSDGLFGYVTSLRSLVDAVTPYLPLKPTVNGYIAAPTWDGSLSILSLLKQYKNGLSPANVIESLYERLAASATDASIWIHLVPKADLLKFASSLESRFPDRNNLPPLYGIPFSIKDSIDLADVPTTTACPPLAYTPTASAAVIEKLVSLGAIPVGKANLDQLATGLTGLRSPYGTPASSQNPRYVSGGSSSGSAVSVGQNLVSFSVATDTAGSGRVPAGFNNIVGWKPTKNTLSFRGVVTACESLDCIALMAQDVADVRRVWRFLRDYDPQDRYAKFYPPIPRPVHAIGPKATSFRFAIPPEELVDSCSPDYRKLFYRAMEKAQELGGIKVSIDYTPVDLAGRLLYDGTFVNERLAGLPENFLSENLSNLHPVIKEIFTSVLNRKQSAADAYRDLHAMMSYRQQVRETLFTPREGGIDVLIVPTAPEHPTIERASQEPIKINSRLGTFTHAGNVLDLCGCAVPAGSWTDADSSRLPFSVTLLGGERTDAMVLGVAERLQKALGERW